MDWVVQPQHVLGDYMLDMAMMDRDRKLDIECDVLTSLDSTGAKCLAGEEESAAVE